GATGANSAAPMAPLTTVQLKVNKSAAARSVSVLIFMIYLLWLYLAAQRLKVVIEMCGHSALEAV
ncbi:MAG: hypothetical protein AAF609_27050, partial [Cyanobacteria bacterium P01_C01_bin.120]